MKRKMMLKSNRMSTKTFEENYDNFWADTFTKEEQAVTEENNDQTNINCVSDINTEQQKHHNQLR